MFTFVQVSALGRGDVSGLLRSQEEVDGWDPAEPAEQGVELGSRADLFTVVDLQAGVVHRVDDLKCWPLCRSFLL